MAIEDYEWDAEAELAETARAPRISREGLLTRMRRSVWLEPALKLAGMGALLGALAAIGVVAQSYMQPGLKLPAASAVDALAGSWLKPSPSAERPIASTWPAAHRSAGGPASASASAASPSGSPAPSPSEAAPASPGLTSDGRVVLNSASADELTRLPGVGKRRAEAIVALRTKLKRFKQPSDLLRVKGIGPRGLKRMLPHLVLDAP